MNRYRVPIVTLAAMALIAGCTSSDDTADEPTTVAPPETATTVATVTTGVATVAAADRSVEDLQAIADRGILTVIRVSDDLGTTTVASGVAVDGQPVTADDAFPIFSITKMMSAAVVLALAEDGLLALDDPVADHVDFAFHPDITIRQLLSHHSGLPKEVPWGCDPSVVQEVAAAGPIVEPGVMDAYSNAGYLVVGGVIGAVTGEDIAVAFNDEVFGPAGMTSTYFPESQEGPTPLTGVDESVTCPVNDVAFRTHGGLISTAGDLEAFLRGLFEGAVLTDESLDEMLDFQSDILGEPYGLGVAEWTRGIDEPSFYGHAGSVEDVEAIANYDPASRRTIVVFVQGGDVQSTFWKVADWAEGA